MHPSFQNGTELAYWEIYGDCQQNEPANLILIIKLSSELDVAHQYYVWPVSESYELHKDWDSREKIAQRPPVLQLMINDNLDTF